MNLGRVDLGAEPSVVSVHARWLLVRMDNLIQVGTRWREPDIRSSVLSKTSYAPPILKLPTQVCEELDQQMSQSFAFSAQVVSRVSGRWQS